MRCVFVGRHCANLRALVVTGGANMSNNGLKSLVDGCTQLTVSNHTYSQVEI